MPRTVRGGPWRSNDPGGGRRLRQAVARRLLPRVDACSGGMEADTVGGANEAPARTRDHGRYRTSVRRLQWEG